MATSIYARGHEVIMLCPNAVGAILPQHRLDERYPGAGRITISTSEDSPP